MTKADVVAAARMVVRDLMAEGRCVDCQQPKEPNRLTYRLCRSCALNDPKGRGAKIGEKKQRLFATGYEAMIACKRCGRRFESPDRRSVRHCEPCRKWLSDRADHFAVADEGRSPGNGVLQRRRKYPAP